MTGGSKARRLLGSLGVSGQIGGLGAEGRLGTEARAVDPGSWETAPLRSRGVEGQAAGRRRRIAAKR